MRHAGMIALSAVLALAACKDENKTETTTTAATTAAATTAAPNATGATTAAATATEQATAAAAAVAVSPDMTAFMGMLDGKDGSARKALKKYGVAAVQGDDLGMYMLQNPKVTKSEKSGDSQCYTMETEAGIMKHVTQVCWDAKNKISKITDTSS